MPAAGKTTTMAGSTFIQAVSCVALLAAQAISKDVVCDSAPQVSRRVVVFISANTHTAVDTLLSSISRQWPSFMKRLEDHAENGYAAGSDGQRMAQSVSAWLKQCQGKETGSLELVKVVSRKGCGNRPAIVSSLELPCKVWTAEEKSTYTLLSDDGGGKKVGGGKTVGDGKDDGGGKKLCG